MRTCSAFGGFVKSSAASAVAGASSGSITTGSALGLRRQAPIVAPSGCLLAARGLGWAALAPWQGRSTRVRTRRKLGLLDPDAASMGVRHQEEGGDVSSSVFGGGRLAPHPKPLSFDKQQIAVCASVRHRAVQTKVYTSSLSSAMALCEIARRAVACLRS